MSRWPYSMARFTVRELNRMQRGAYPYVRSSDDDPVQDWGSRPRHSWTASEKAVVWVIGMMAFLIFALIWEVIIWPALVDF